MAVPTKMSDLSVVAGDNSPLGSESPISTDDFHRSIQAILRTTNAKGSDIASATTTDIGAATAEFVDVTGTTTITGLGTIGAGIVRTVRFTGVLTLTHNATSLILPTGRNIPTSAGDIAQFRSLGSGNWVCVGYLRANGYPLNQRKGADVASATTLPLINDGNYFDVTGTTTITAFASLGVGTWIGLHFDDILTLTHSADLVLPTGANITTAAGDEAIFVEYASGDWRCVSYTRADGTPISGVNFADASTFNAGTNETEPLNSKIVRENQIIALTPVTLTNQTQVTFPDIPAWVKKFTVVGSQFSTNGTSVPLIRLGDSGGIEATGYEGTAGFISGSSAGSGAYGGTGFALNSSHAAASKYIFAFEFWEVSPNVWVGKMNGGYSTNSAMLFSGGTKTLSDVLTDIQVTTTNGTDQMDDGIINVFIGG